MIVKTKRLIFYFYVPSIWKTLKSVELHLNCLKNYVHIFDEALFIISVDDISDTVLINEFEHILLNLGFNGNITFKVQENSILYEAKSLNEEIFQKMDKLDGLTFFGHSKGIGNEIYNSCEWEELKTWICGLYFLSLEFIHEVESKLYGVWCISYGPFKSTWDELDNKYHWIYSGTFFWLNCPRLYDKINRQKLEIRHCNDRFFSEQVLGDLLEFNSQTEHSNIVSSHNESYLINANNFYDYVNYYITLILNDFELDKFYNFKKLMSPIIIDEE